MKVEINGKSHDLDVNPDMPILWVLRDILKFKGTKFGCGKGLCGACTVHLNGQAIRSCSVPISGAENQKLTTIEGVFAQKGNKVIAAWEKHNVPQCGYCQPGQIMTACAFLAETKKPKDSDIDAMMSGNICRCGTYPRIRAAIKTAAYGKGE